MANPAPNSPTHGPSNAVMQRYSIGRTKLYELLKDRRIRAKKLGAKTLIEFASVDAYLADLPDYQAAA